MQAWPWKRWAAIALMMRRLPLPRESYLDSLDESNMNEITFGVPWHFLENLQSRRANNFSNALDVLKGLGAKIIEIDLDICKYSIAVYYILATAEASTNLARFDGIRYGVSAPEKRKILWMKCMICPAKRDSVPRSRNESCWAPTSFPPAIRTPITKKRRKCARCSSMHLKKPMNSCDAVLLPVSPTTAFPLDSIHDPIANVFAGYLHRFPPISPACRPSAFLPDLTTGSLPFGLQFIGPQLHDVPVIQYAHAYEMATLYTRKIPPAFEAS